MKKFICWFIGHKKASNMKIEDDYCNYTKGCPRCKTPAFMTGTLKNIPETPKNINNN